MKYLISILSILFSILLMTSCRTKVDTPSIDLGPDLPFVQCYLNPTAEKISLKLSIAQVLNNNGTKISPEILQNAEVKIGDGISNVLIPFERLMYQAALFTLDQSLYPILPGKKYYLEIKLDDLINISAETVIPLDDYTFEENITGPRSASIDYLVYDVDVNISLSSSSLAYFRIGLGNPVTHQVYTESFIDNSLTQQASLNIRNSIDYYWMDQGNIELSIMRYNAETYQFLKQLNSQYNNSGNPFAEPSSLITNIQGGLGIFGGMYTKSKIL